ncbi:MAG TPA: hypothetical protein VFV46_09965 [Lacibacter sp.]|nr:hypothetical protein [Lacibacter sp.]
MEQTNHSQPANTTGNSEATIFNDLITTDEHEKKFKTARVWLYVLAGFQFVMGIIEYAREEGMIAWFAAGIDWFIALCFFLLAIWSKKKPATAFLTSLIFYGCILTVLALIEPASILKGIIFKVLIIIALYKAYTMAKEYEELKSI